MPIALVLPAAAAAIKLGGFALASFIHEFSKHFGNNGNVATVNALSFINTEQSLRLVNEGSLETTPSNAMVIYGSRSIIPSSSSRGLVTLGNRSLVNICSQVKTQIGKLASRIFGLAFHRQLVDVSLISVDLKQFVDWYFGRIIDLMQSACRSRNADWKEMICALLVGSVSECTAEKEAIISISTLSQALSVLQARLSSFISKAIVTLKEATHLLVKCEQENVLCNIFHQQVPIEKPIKASHSEMVEVEANHSVASSHEADVSKHRLSSIIVFIANVKRILSMVFVRSLDGHLDPLRRGSVRVSALICAMLFVSVSIIGWNIPFTFVGCGCVDSRLNYEMQSRIATPRMISPSSQDIVNDAVIPSAWNLGNFPSLPMHSQEGPVDANFNMDSNSLSSLSWSDGVLWKDSVSQCDTKGETHSKIVWTAESSSFDTFAFATERDADGIIPYKMTAEQHLPDEIESFDAHVFNVYRVGLVRWSNGECSIDSSSTSLIVVQSHAKSEAIMQIRSTEPSSLTRYEVTRCQNEMISFAVPMEQLELNDLEVYDEPALVDLQHSWRADKSLAGNPLQPSVEVVYVSQITWYTQSHWAPICHGFEMIEMNHFILMVDLDGGTSSSHRFESEHSALIVANEVDIYVAAINMGDCFSFIGIIQADSLVNVLVGSMAKRALDLHRSSNYLVIAASERPQEHSLIEYPFRGTLSIAEPSSNLSMRLIPLFDQLMPHIRHFLPIEAVSNSARTRMSLSTSSPSLAHIKLGYSFEVINAGLSSRILESSYLAWLLLLLLWNNCDDFEDSAEAAMVSDSKTPAIESDTIFTDEWTVFEERQLIEKRKRMRTKSKTLHSDLGRHWKSPGKRRMRRSSRIRSKPKYFEPV